MRQVYLIAGILSVGLGALGSLLPLLPTVPFMLAAAFFFARSNPEWEQRLLDDPRLGPSMRAWRERRAISLYGKLAALTALAISALVGLVFLDMPWRFVPMAVAVLCGTWIVTRRT